MKQKCYPFFVNFSSAEMESQTDVYLISLSPDTQQPRKKYLSNPKNVSEESDLIQESNPGPSTWKWVGLRGQFPSGERRPGKAWELLGASVLAQADWESTSSFVHPHGPLSLTSLSLSTSCLSSHSLLSFRAVLLFGMFKS